MITSIFSRALTDNFYRIFVLVWKSSLIRNSWKSYRDEMASRH